MQKLTIITINYNNASGLHKTMQSVFSQTSQEFEYIVIDGGSSDDSKNIITQYADKANFTFRWISEKDNGIYHAMNKGIQLAQGEYIQFINSGDCLANDSVTDNMLNALTEETTIFYGNMLKLMHYGILRDKGFAGRQPTMLDFYRGTLNHSPAYIKRSLFDQYGLYDESLKIVSDWKWYLQVIILGNENVKYNDIDVTIFDMTGISNINSKLDKEERLKVLKNLLPDKILQDYQKWSFPISQMQRLKKHKWPDRLFYFFERMLFKIDKNKIKRQKEISF